MASQNRGWPLRPGNLGGMSRKRTGKTLTGREEKTVFR
ncbi:unnamed protein product [Gulo gulo]|uniref:Uncharacterized protein n=1 Tax=Gulo gulo TaxID=48420 RepID=A0A9X9QB55_GULGU|nr:unnamed protein product [Gulo gulo]